MWNPWGWRETWTLDSVWEDWYLVHAFENFLEQPAGVDVKAKTERDEFDTSFRHLFNFTAPPPPPPPPRRAPADVSDLSDLGGRGAERQPSQRYEQDGNIILFYTGAERPPVPKDAIPQLG